MNTIKINVNEFAIFLLYIKYLYTAKKLFRLKKEAGYVKTGLGLGWKDNYHNQVQFFSEAYLFSIHFSCFCFEEKRLYTTSDWDGKVFSQHLAMCECVLIAQMGSWQRKWPHLFPMAQ